MKSRTGFTLIELLVVISIIALLSSVVMASLNTARSKGRLAAAKQFAAQVEHVAADSEVVGLDFNECSGTSAADSSGNNNNAGLVGSVAWSTDTPSGTGCSLSVSGGYATLASASIASYTTGVPFTVSVWVKQSAIQNRAGFVSTAHYQNGGYMLAEGASVAGKPFFEINGSGTSCGAEGTTNMVVGDWTNMVGVYDGTAMTLYVDGAVAMKTTGCNALIDNTYALLVGKTMQGGWGAASGTQLDGVRVYSKALTASEVGALYASEAPGHRLADRK